MTARAEEEITPGLRAGIAVLSRRPQDVLRVGFSEEAQEEIAPLLEHTDARHVDARLLDPRSLDRFAGSEHHEGLAVVARPRTWMGAKKLAEDLCKNRGVCVAFDRVRNPYNVGAILRTAAFFGVDAALFGPIATGPGLHPTAVRVAEGGTEHLALARTTDLGATLAHMRTLGIRVVGADGHARASAFAASYERPAVIVLGNEREGMSLHVRRACDAIVAIPGSGAVESLNVAIAASLLIAEATRSRNA